MLAAVKRNWYAVMPEEALAGKKGVSVVQFEIERDGNLRAAGPQLERTSTTDSLDNAAMIAVRVSAPFERLPSDFHGPRIALRFAFLYNIPGSMALPSNQGNVPGSMAFPSNQGLVADPTSIRIEMLTDTQGVDFQTYLRRLVEDVKRKWNVSMPSDVLNGQKGKTILRFQIERDGHLNKHGPRVEWPSTSGALDNVVLNVVRNSAPFERLPKEFHGRRIEIRLSFFYNDPGQIIPQ